MASVIGLTMGDPAGIGPEIIVKACGRLADRLADGSLELVVLGSRTALDAAAAQLGHPPVPTQRPVHGGAWLSAVVGDDAAFRPGEVSATGGEVAYRAVSRAVALAQQGAIDAIVTAPLNKEALNLAGHRFAGHTDMLAALTGARDSVMMLAHGPLRVTHVSTHVALADVPARLTPARLSRVVMLTDAALRELGIGAPRIAVAALNPHAGEGGLFGAEDMTVTEPTVRALRERGFDVMGPVPGDTVFVRLRAGQYDAVVAMYHDQGHIPVKLLGFTVDPATGAWTALSGVNITLGLPIIRTSVDHGTAFDIAGRGIASEASLLEAIDYAERLAAARRQRS
jgi:4-hydroxythreonine-4-phosphate dehydrogenase